MYGLYHDKWEFIIIVSLILGKSWKN